MQVLEEYYLMNRDSRILRFLAFLNDYHLIEFREMEFYSTIRPLGFVSIHMFIKGRQAPKKRKNMEGLLEQYNCTELTQFLNLTLALSLNDTYWVKPVSSRLLFGDVSLYDHDFNEVIARTAFEGGFTHGFFPSTSPEFGTDGTYAKCWVRNGEQISLIKCGSPYMGLEPFSEFYSAQIAKIICKDFVDYKLVKYCGKISSTCDLFTSEQIGYVQANKLLPYYTTEKEIVSLFEQHGCGDLFRRMVVLDALIFNTDRHLGNFGFLVNNETQEILKMAPMFDHNQGMLPYAKDADLVNLAHYLPTRIPVLGGDFNIFAHAMLTDEIRADLLNLKGFQFERDNRFNLKRDRLEVFERIIDCQVTNILEGQSVYHSRYDLAGLKKVSLDEKILQSGGNHPQKGVLRESELER